MMLNQSVPRSQAAGTPASTAPRLPAELQQIIVALTASDASGWLAATSLYDASRSNHSMAAFVDNDPVLKPFLQQHKALIRAEQSGAHHPAMLGLQNGQRIVDSACRPGNERQLAHLLNEGAPGTLSPGLQLQLVQQVLTTRSASQRLPMLVSLAKHLPELLPALQREVVTSLLRREQQEIQLLSAGMSDIRAPRGSDEHERQQQIMALERTHHQALRALLSGFAVMTPDEQASLFPLFCGPDALYDADSLAIGHLAAAAAHLSEDQLLSLLSAGSVSHSRLQATMAAIGHFPQETIDALFDEFLSSADAGEPPAAELAQMALAMGDGIRNVGEHNLQRLKDVLPQLPEAGQAEMCGALAPVADRLTAQQQQEMVSTVIHCEDIDAQVPALAALNRHITSFSLEQQDQLVSLSLRHATQPDALHQPADVLARQFASLAPDHQRELQQLIAAPQLAAAARSSLITALAQGYTAFSAREMARQPWDELIRTASGLRDVKARAVCLQAISNSLGVMVEKRLATLL